MRWAEIITITTTAEGVVVVAEWNRKIVVVVDGTDKIPNGKIVGIVVVDSTG